MSLTRLMDLDDTAKYLGVSKLTVYNWTSAKRIPFRKVGKFLRFDRKSLEQWTYDNPKKKKAEDNAMSYAETEIKQNSKYLKIDEGKPMVIRLLDDPPVEMMKHSLKGAVDGKFQVECKGEEYCELCQDGQDPIQKFITNVYNHTVHKVQLYEFGPMIAKAIKKIAVNLAEEGQDIMNYDLKVEAEGAGMQKKYTVTPRTTSQPVPPGLVKIKIDSNLAF